MGKGDGNVNTVDVIMPAFPMYYALAPSYIKLLLDPILRYLSTGASQAAWELHDIGSSYSNATGHNKQIAEEMPIEETGNLLILVYAYIHATNDTSWSDPYLPLLQSYADYLVSNSINITNQLSTTDATGPLPNETNLAVKAALGLKALGAFSGLQNYWSIGDDHAKLLWNLGLGTDNATNPTHFTLTYPHNLITHKLTFNLYPDLLLSLNTFPATAFNTKSTDLPSIHLEGGIPLDNRQDWTKTDWLLWVAGYVGQETRDSIVGDIWTFVRNGLNSWPFSDRFVVTTEKGGVVGREVALRARPTVGGYLSLVALQGAGSLMLDDGNSAADEGSGKRQLGVNDELDNEVDLKT